MKMNQETFARLRAAINADGGLIPEATMRQRWDALWRTVDSGRFDYTTLHDLDDAHIDTALRAIAS